MRTKKNLPFNSERCVREAINRSKRSSEIFSMKDSLAISDLDVNRERDRSR